MVTVALGVGSGGGSRIERIKVAGLWRHNKGSRGKRNSVSVEIGRGCAMAGDFKGPRGHLLDAVADGLRRRLDTDTGDEHEFLCVRQQGGAEWFAKEASVREWEVNAIARRTVS